jgi:hypothetical protein
MPAPIEHHWRAWAPGLTPAAFAKQLQSKASTVTRLSKAGLLLKTGDVTGERLMGKVTA